MTIKEKYQIEFDKINRNLELMNKMYEHNTIAPKFHEKLVAEVNMLFSFICMKEKL